MAQMQQQEDKLALGPKKFNMWIFIFTSFMLFAAFTSGFIVYVGGRPHALGITLPSVFGYSTAVLVISSITLFLASKASKSLQFERQRLFLWLTLFFGTAFLVLQIYGWYILAYNMRVFFTNPNAAQSFIYVLTLCHLIHIIAGLLLLANTLRGSYKNIPQVKNLFGMEMSSIFWHFVDIIWIYLYVFLLLNQY